MKHHFHGRALFANRWTWPRRILAISTSLNRWLWLSIIFSDRCDAWFFICTYIVWNIMFLFSSIDVQETEKLSDDDLYRYLADIRKPTGLAKRLKCIPGRYIVCFIFIFKTWSIFLNKLFSIYTYSCNYFVKHHWKLYHYVHDLGMLKFDLSPFSEDFVTNCLSPELLRLQQPIQVDDELSLTKEILEFPTKEVYAPNFSYRCSIIRSNFSLKLYFPSFL